MTFEEVLKEQLEKRQSVIEKAKNKDINYFKIIDYLDLEHYSTYIFITPRSIGKTYSQWELVISVYQMNGEYTVWMRSTVEELKNVILDYKSNRPAAWPDWCKLEQDHLIDVRNQKVVAKFVALSTVGNFASITGDGCFGIIYDEFLRRTGRPIKNSYRKLTDFMRTLERGHLITVILSANLTTLDNDILLTLKLWNDVLELDDKTRRLRYRLIENWENPPMLAEVSTAHIWAKNDEDLRAFMEDGKVLDKSGNIIIPVDRLVGLRYLNQFKLYNNHYTMAYDNDNNLVIMDGIKSERMFIEVLSTEDGFSGVDGRYVRPYNLETSVGHIKGALESGALRFTSFQGKNDWIKFLVALQGKYMRHL